MVYRREEPFRFQFRKPLQGTFRILKMGEMSNLSKEGEAIVLDLSPNGVRIATPLNLPVEEEPLLIELSFLLNRKQIKILAEPKWKKRTGASSYSYGLVGVDDAETKNEIIRELKEFSRKQLEKKQD